MTGVHWLVKSYGRYGRYSESSRALLEERVPVEEVPQACARALEAGAVEIITIEVRPHVEKKRSPKDGSEL